MAARQSVAPAPPQARRQSSASKSRNPTFQSNPFVVAAAVAIAGTSLIVAADRLTVDQLQVHRINSADAPTLDGDTSDRAWRNIVPFSLMTSEGGNFDGKGETRIEISRGTRRHMGVFPVYMGRSDAIAETPATDQGSGRMARASRRP